LPEIVTDRQDAGLPQMQVDTVFEILKMLWATPMRPGIINFESARLSPSDKRACAEMLTREGYRYLNVGRFDTLALRQDGV
jgi:hypothetical protein